MYPNFAVAHYELGQALVQKHMYGEVIAELETATKLSADSPICKSTLAYAYAVSGRRNEALKILNDLTRQSEDFSSAAEIAFIYTCPSENDRAMVWQEKIYSERLTLPSSCGPPSTLCAPIYVS